MSFGIEVTHISGGDPNSRAGRPARVRTTGEAGVVAEPARGGRNGPQMDIGSSMPLTIWLYFEQTSEFRLFASDAVEVGS